MNPPKIDLVLGLLIAIGLLLAAPLQAGDSAPDDDSATADDDSATDDDDSATTESVADDDDSAVDDDDSAGSNPFDGVIEGGWGYVAGAYGLSLGVLLVYVLVVTFRLRRLRNKPPGS